MKMKKLVPNMLTCCNLLSGCMATAFAISGNATQAFLFIILGAVFDFFDGMSARLLNVSSPIGKELDSLADDITFGVAPASMVFFELSVMDMPSLLIPVRHVVPYAAFVMAAFSAVRLAKFNLDSRQTASFIGLPTPANALFWGSLMVGSTRFLESSPSMVYAVLLMVCISCYVMIAEIPMFALKFKHWGWKGNEIRYIFLMMSALLLVLFRIPGFALIVAWYVVLSAFTSLKESNLNH